STGAKMLIVALGIGFVLAVVGGVVAAGLMLRPAATTVVENTNPPPPPTPSGASLDRIRQRGELRVLMDTGTPAWSGSPPTIFYNGGEPDGLDYRLSQEIAKAVGVPKVKVVHALYTELAGKLRADTEVDMVAAGFVPYPEEGLAWSDPYLEFGLCLIVASDSKIKTTQDLWGKKVGIYPDDAAEKEVMRFAKGYTSLERIEQGYFELLINKKLDAYIYDYPYAVAEINTHYSRFPQHKGKLKIAQYNLTDSTYNVAVRESEKDLLSIVNQAIAAWRASPAYEADLRRYLSPTDDSGSSPEPVAGGRSHKVAPGETLSSIASAEYKNPDKWKAIWEANKSRLPNPNLVEVGDVLVLPE
ncbi:MAG TPA: transporter substrate-binding domain-containing protein, partial [Myxococcota bacterium]|nr:transporter substrate-binding domain-containing protein [Myxococcota bacterium]